MSLLASLAAIVGKSQLLVEPSQRLAYETDWRAGHIGRALAVVRPGSTAEVVALVKACAAQSVPLVPQGGNTGLAGGSVPDASGSAVVISLSRLNRIRLLDAAERLVIAEAGVTQQRLIDAAEAAGLSFPVSLGARDSCQLGGSVASNAGGLQALKYGMMCANIRGLEVVLPSGELFSDLAALRKDNRGYALRELFIGSEGTLGIVTAAAVTLHPALPERETLFVGLESVEAALDLLLRLERHFPDRLLSAELIPRLGLVLAARHQEAVRDPFAAAHPWYGLFELGFPASGQHGFQHSSGVRDLLLDALSDAPLAEALLAESASQRANFWRAREGLNQSQAREGLYFAQDISVARNAIPELVRDASAASQAHLPGVRPLVYGHLGDGSLHFNLLKPEAMSDADFAPYRQSLSDIVYAKVEALGGSYSAEHGIGATKRERLAQKSDRTTLALMRQVKQLLDPNGLMNPGKVL